MTKKKITTINIDEELIKRAKKEIPNVSVFFEGCLKSYLDGDEDAKTIQDEINRIKQSRLNIHILTARNEEIEFNKTVDYKKQNTAWISVWGLYRATEQYNNEDLERAGSILNTSGDELKLIMDTLKLYCSPSELRGCDDWNFAKKTYESYK